MRFTDIDINFDVKYEGQQNCPKIISMDILRVLVTIICDVKIDVNMCEPHCVNLFFFVNLLHSLGVWFFDISQKMSNICPIVHVPCHPCLPSRSMHYYAQFQKIHVEQACIHAPI